VRSARRARDEGATELVGDEKERSGAGGWPGIELRDEV